MSRSDLARWNRAGLSRVRYVDGNAATYLEDLRAGLFQRFGVPPEPRWSSLPPGPQVETEPIDESVGAEIDRQRKRLARLLEQYRGDRGDWGWEIARALARSCHILTEHLDAFANEGFLDTATRWENVRRLVEMLDYTPAPPASASTVLALEAKSGLTGKVEAGLQVEHQPPAGGEPVVFETLDDVTVDPALNRLRLKGYGLSAGIVSGTSLALEDQLDDLTLGQPVVVEAGAGGALEGRFLVGAVAEGVGTRITLSEALQPTNRGLARVHLEPADRLRPVGGSGAQGIAGYSGGATIKRLLALDEVPVGLRPPTVVFITDGTNSHFSRLRRIHGRRLILEEDLGTLRLDRAWVSPAHTISVLSQGGRSVGEDKDAVKRHIIAVTTPGDLSSLQGTTVAHLRTTGEGKQLSAFNVFAATYEAVDSEKPDSGGFTTLRLEGPHELTNPQTLFVPAVGRRWRVDTFLKGQGGAPLPLDLTVEKPKKTSAGDLVVAAAKGQLAWGRVVNVSIDDDKGHAVIRVEGWKHRGGGLFFLAETVVYGHFRTIARPEKWDENTTPVVGSGLCLAGETVPSGLRVGQSLVLEKRIGSALASAFLTRVSEITPLACKVEVDPPVPADLEFEVGSTLVRGNLVGAGHGERQPVKVLGSGDATSSGQSFDLEKKGVSFVADSTQSSGVRADTRLTVEGRAWTQVATLRDSRPTDLHYTVRPTEEGFVRLTFGDGRHGRRLPTGSNNVRIAYRVGNGLAGNLDPGGLTTLVRPHPFVEAVHQPLRSTGGNSMESVESLRANAPASVLTLGRAVSVVDFAHLAERQASVWQATAIHRRAVGASREQVVEVVVIQAGGAVQLSDSLRSQLRDTLQGHAAPGVIVVIESYRPRRVDLEVDLRIAVEQFQPEQVVSAVHDGLASALSLRRRRLGADLYLSEVYQVVEAVPGVASSTCSFAGLHEKRLEASEREVIYLGSADVDFEEYRP